MTAGLAFEGLNHAGIENSNILVILTTTVCQLTQTLALLKNILKISTSKIYNDTKNEIWSLLGKLSNFGSSAKEIVSRTEKALKSSYLRIVIYLNLLIFGILDLLMATIWKI